MEINGHTRLLGLIGWPVSHSLSPAMHNAAAAALGLNLVYIPLPVQPDRLPAAIAGLPALGFTGINVTVPHKEAVIPLLDDVDAGARALGAVNTILFQEEMDRAVGYNTDWTGFLNDLEALDVHPEGRPALILGAGGSSRAVAYALASSGAQVHVLARRLAQAEQLVDDLAVHVPAGSLVADSLTRLASVYRALAPSLIVNTTPVGMKPHVDASPWPDDLPFPSGAFVYDLVYNPAETMLMRQARAAGCRTANGLGMLLRQGAAAFRLWTAQEPDLVVMKAAIE